MCGEKVIMKPYLHAESSARKFGGVAGDYIDIHVLMDSSKSHIADHRHRAIFHSSFGCFIVELIFGVTRTNSDGGVYSPRDVAEQHCLEDLGTIPSVQDWLKDLPIEPWMSGGGAPGALLNPIVKLDDAVEAIKNLESTVSKQFKSWLEPLLIRLLEENPDRCGVQWTQYTPYFNDGDACEFSVGYLEWFVEGAKNEYHGIYPLPPYLSEIFQSRESAVISMFKAAFGDHVRVQYTLKHRFETFEYMHE